MLLTKDEIKYFKENQEEITSDLLDALRSQGKEGKHQALAILDMKQNNKMFYLDAFGSSISYDGNKGLKSPNTILDLKPIHIEEFEKCANDFTYFRENYIQIKTHEGIDFPDVREYQDRFIDKMLDDDKEDVVGLMGRQCIGEDSKLDILDEEGHHQLSIKELWELSND